MALLSTHPIESLQHAMHLLLGVATRERLSEVLLPVCDGISGARAAVLWLPEGAAEFEPPAPVPEALRSGDLVVEGTLAAVPLAAHGRTFGAIRLELVDRPALDREEVALLRALGHAASGAIERILRLEREARFRKEEAQLTQVESANAEVGAAFDNAPVGQNLLDRELRFRWVNRFCAEINGLSAEAHIGKTVSEVLPRRLAGELEPKLRRVLETGQVFDETLTAEMPARSGRLRDWRALFYPVRDAAGATLGVATIVREVTAERDADRRKLRKAARDSALVQATSVILWGLDASGAIVEDSPSWRAFTGMRFEDQKAEPGRLQAVHPDDRARVRAAWSHAMGAKCQYEIEVRMRRHDGVYVWMLSRLVPVLDETGEVVEWMGADTDISERKRAEEGREATLRFAEQFIGILSHDLRSPLAAVQMGAEMLKRQPDCTPDARPLVERIAASAHRMENMVAQLLDLTRVRLGKGLTVERRPMNLTPVIVAVIDELRLVHPGRAIACDFETVVDGAWDGDRLAQVVSNLVGNALQHGDAARSVEVRLAVIDSAAVFEVQSYGPPIARDLLSRVFDPYRQGGIRDARSRGLGLGLFITQQIVLAHGGRIDVRSRAAEGTRFTVTLPRG
jgi:PAS domain S-box-containing protein